MSLSTNNTFCGDARPFCISTCEDTANLCDNFADGISSGLKPLSIICFTLGGLYVLKGTSIALLTTQKMVKKCLEKREEQRRYSLSSEDLSIGLLTDPPPESKKADSIWSRIYNVAHSYTMGALPLASGFILYKIPQLIQTNGCDALRGQCLKFGATGITTCNWANDWLIEALKEFIKEYMKPG